MGARDLRFRMLATVGAIVALGSVWATWHRGWPVRFDAPLLTLAVASVVSDLLAVTLPNDASVSLTYPLNVSAVVLLGPGAAAAVAAVSTLPYLLPRNRTSAARLVWNAAQIVISALVAAWAYVLAGGRPLAAAPLAESDFPAMLPALLLAATMGLLANVVFAGVGHAMIQGLPIVRVWRQSLSWMVAPQAALGLLGIAIAQVMAVEGSSGFLLFVLPLVVARQMHRRYLSLRETYADAVRSLVAAVEAKDPYTKGHSVRVARYVAGIARAMSLGEREVERLEYAALLHDLGKIGISRAVLSKPSALSLEEYALIRQHPDIGARILESVPFLDDVRPVVQGHHERIDGAGYGHGLAGEAIPLSARILAVADCYDAMTAERPYRAALSVEHAVAELRAGSGSQFDGAVVEVLIDALPTITATEGDSSSLVLEGGQTGA